MAKGGCITCRNHARYASFHADMLEEVKQTQNTECQSLPFILGINKGNINEDSIIISIHKITHIQVLEFIFNTQY